MKSLIAVVTGITVGLVALFLVQLAGDSLLASTMGIERVTAQGANALGIARPVESLLVVLAAQAVASLLGGYLAARLAPSKLSHHAIVVGGFLMGIAVAGLLMFPQPAWFVWSSLVAFLPPALLGATLARRSNRGGVL